jgi:hypothetical protein
MIWKPREGKGPYVSWGFDSQMQFMQWRKYTRRPEAQGTFIETLSFAGPCFFIHRDRYWELGGCDEKHGSWGQFGTEWACKSWLSGGKLITTRNTWFAHLFRTGNFKGSGYKGSSFPYPISGDAQERAKEYSRDLWLNDKWEGAIHPLSWLIERFAPCLFWDNHHISLTYVARLEWKPNPGICRKKMPGAYMYEGNYLGIQPLMDADEACGEWKEDV